MGLSLGLIWWTKIEDSYMAKVPGQGQFYCIFIRNLYLQCVYLGIHILAIFYLHFHYGLQSF